MDLTAYEKVPIKENDWNWAPFTNEVLTAIHALPQPVVFLFWGAAAVSRMDSLVTSYTILEKNNYVVREDSIKKAFILTSSPFYLQTPKTLTAFAGSKPFTTTNKLLKKFGGEPVDWTL